MEIGLRSERKGEVRGNMIEKPLKHRARELGLMGESMEWNRGTSIRFNGSGIGTKSTKKVGEREFPFQQGMDQRG